MDLEVVWSGSQKDVYLCVPPAEIRSMAHIKPAVLRRKDQTPHRDLSAHRAKAIQLLRTKKEWRVTDLRGLIGLDPASMSGILQRLRRDRVIRSLGHGYVSAYRRPISTDEIAR